jgi:UDP-glucose 4-epimerase
MKCLILGGGGFLGSHLCDALLEAGHAVRIFERPNLKHFRAFKEGERVEWVEGDFLNDEAVSAAVAGCDIVFHLVSTTLPSTSNDNPAYDVRTNVVGTIHLLDVACRYRIKKVIFASSGGTVYGIPKNVPVSESHPTDPTSSYGICKLANEKYLQLYHVLRGLDYCVLRLSNPFGERQRVTVAQGAVSVFLHKAICGEPIEIWGDGSVVRDYFHVSNAVTAFLKAIDHSGPARVFNIGAGVGRSLNQVLSSIEAVVGRRVERIYMPSRPFDVPVNVLDISSAQEFLGWQPHVSFEEGLARTMVWMKAHAM